MQAGTLSAVALKTWATILLIDAAISVPAILGLFGAGENTGTPREVWRVAGIWNIASLILSIAAGVIVLKYADRVTHRLFGAEEINLAVDAQQLEQVAFGTIGVYFMVLSIRQLARAGFELATRPALETPGLEYLWQNHTRVIVDGSVELLAGTFLLLGRRGLAFLWSRLRGYEASIEPEDEGPSA